MGQSFSHNIFSIRSKSGKPQYQEYGVRPAFPTGLSNWIPSSRCAVFRFSVFLPIFGFFQRFGRSALSFFCRFFLEVSVFFQFFFRIFSDFFSDYFQIFLARFFGQIFLKSTKLKFRFWGSGDVIESATEILVWCSAD